MTENPYLPFLIAKTISCTECGEQWPEKVVKLFNKYLLLPSSGEKDKGGEKEKETTHTHTQSKVNEGEGGGEEEEKHLTIKGLRELEKNFNRHTRETTDRMLLLESVLPPTGGGQLEGLYNVPWFLECNHSLATSTYVTQRTKAHRVLSD